MDLKWALKNTKFPLDFIFRYATDGARYEQTLCIRATNNFHVCKSRQGKY